MRSDPDGYVGNNWSTKGNINPYTGEEGTRTYGGLYPGTSLGIGHRVAVPLFEAVPSPSRDWTPPSWPSPSLSLGEGLRLGRDSAAQSAVGVPWEALSPAVRDELRVSSPHAPSATALRSPASIVPLLPRSMLGGGSPRATAQYDPGPAAVGDSLLEALQRDQLTRLRADARREGVAVSPDMSSLDILERMQLERVRANARREGVAVSPDMSSLDILERMQLERLRADARREGVPVSADMSSLDILERMQLERLRAQARRDGVVISSEMDALEILQAIRCQSRH